MHPGLSRSPSRAAALPADRALVFAVSPMKGGIATMTVTITRAHRDALYEEMLTDLTGIGTSTSP
jgi:hypothetical protein